MALVPENLERIAWLRPLLTGYSRLFVEILRPNDRFTASDGINKEIHIISNEDVKRSFGALPVRTPEHFHDVGRSSQARQDEVPRRGCSRAVDRVLVAERCFTVGCRNV